MINVHSSRITTFSKLVKENGLKSNDEIIGAPNEVILKIKSFVFWDVDAFSKLDLQL